MKNDEQSRVGAGTVGDSDGWDSNRVRSSTREGSPDCSGRTVRVHKRCGSLMEVNSTRTKRCFRLREDHWLQTKEQVLRLFLSRTWSMMQSISSCGNPGMMVVVVQQALLFRTQVISPGRAAENHIHINDSTRNITLQNISSRSSGAQSSSDSQNVRTPYWSRANNFW